MVPASRAAKSAADAAAAALRLLAPAETAVLGTRGQRDASSRTRLGAERFGPLGKDPQVEVLDRLDLVAQHRRALEVQLLGLGVHPRLDLGDELGHVALLLGQISGQLFLAGPRVVTAGGAPAALHVEDGALHALRRDPLLLV